MQTNKSQIISVVALVVAVIGLSIGFALFSSVLMIKTSADVQAPSNTAFKVVFSTKSSGDSTVFTDSNYLNSDSLEVGTPVINNTATGGPTISGLHVKFTAPEQSVTYKFYAHNSGSVNAYLNQIIFGTATKGTSAVYGSNTSIVCTPAAGASTESVESACQNIKYSITTSNGEYYATSDILFNQLLAVGSNNKPISITISYDGNLAADGAFDVSFGDIQLLYDSYDRNS